jgi:putative NIF3 family GTP cyclohydrolase 1 type 2
MCGAYDLKTAQIVDMEADALVCGEIRHHEALELTGAGIRVISAGHHGTERFFMNLIDRWIRERYPDARVERVGYDDSPTQIFHGGIPRDGV